ncbi:MAG: tetratricopeptide repeat protein [Candidatus Methylomirabilis sp.]|nr:tetratricopeptide repeat protein [Candidatus Methylomirabilis sp.]
MGERPSKTLLLKPIDAVQWSLYYPGIVSVRDYPLTGVAPHRLPERLADAEQRVASGPADPGARLTLAEILFDLGRQKDARTEFEKTLALDPGSPRLAGLGWAYLVEGRIEEALRAFRQATPPTLSALVGEANALYRLNRFDEMDEVIAEAKSRFPSSPQPPTQAALLYLIQGRVAEARQELEHALTLDPGYAPAHGLRSNIALVRNEKGIAQQAAMQAVAANPSSASSYLDLSLAKQAEFRLDEALQAARKALEMESDNPMAMIQVSRLLFGLGNLSEASRMAEEARRRAPSDPLVTSTWGFLLLAQGKTKEAITAFDQAIEQDSTRGEPHLGRGLALFRSGQTEEAVQEMRMATLLEPKVSLYWSYLGKALYEVKRYPEDGDPFPSPSSWTRTIRPRGSMTPSASRASIARWRRCKICSDRSSSTTIGRSTGRACCWTRIWPRAARPLRGSTMNWDTSSLRWLRGGKRLLRIPPTTRPIGSCPTRMPPCLATRSPG